MADQRPSSYRRVQKRLKMFRLDPPPSGPAALVLPLNTLTWEYTTGSYDPEIYGYALTFEKVQYVANSARDIVVKLVSSNRKRRWMGVLAFIFALLSFGGPWLLYSNQNEDYIWAIVCLCALLMLITTMLGIGYRHDYCAVIRKLDQLISKYNAEEKNGVWKIGDYGGWLEFRPSAEIYEAGAFKPKGNHSGLRENLLENNPGAQLVGGEVVVPNQYVANAGNQDVIYAAGTNVAGNANDNVAYGNAPTGSYYSPQGDAYSYFDGEHNMADRHGAPGAGYQNQGMYPGFNDTTSYDAMNQGTAGNQGKPYGGNGN